MKPFTLSYLNGFVYGRLNLLVEQMTFHTHMQTVFHLYRIGTENKQNVVSNSSPKGQDGSYQYAFSDGSEEERPSKMIDYTSNNGGDALPCVSCSKK